MAELKTTYMGIELKNPLIVGACNLVTDIENLKKMEAAGAGAIVYKSLFEEQIQLENFEAEEDLNAYNERNAEMISLFPDMGVVGPQEFLQGLKEAKEILTVRKEIIMDDDVTDEQLGTIIRMMYRAKVEIQNETIKRTKQNLEL